MKLRTVLLSLSMASFATITHAEIIRVGDKAAHQPTIIRGAPIHCHAKGPLVINVAEALKNGGHTARKCDVAFKRRDHKRSISIVNIVVIDQYNERVYIKRH
ncbi:MAG: hypothetical protein ACRCU5_11075 [Rhizobiaceae bacterium]